MPAAARINLIAAPCAAHATLAARPGAPRAPRRGPARCNLYLEIQSLSQRDAISIPARRNFHLSEPPVKLEHPRAGPTRPLSRRPSEPSQPPFSPSVPHALTFRCSNTLILVPALYYSISNPSGIPLLYELDASLTPIAPPPGAAVAPLRGVFLQCHSGALS